MEELVNPCQHEVRKRECYRDGLYKCWDCGKIIFEEDKPTKSENNKSIFDSYFSNYKWYRKLRGGIWCKHQFTKEAQWICSTWVGTWWARYGELNRYSIVIKQENYK